METKRLSGRLVSHRVEDVEILVREADLSAQCREGITQASRLSVFTQIMPKGLDCSGRHAA